MSKKRRRFTPSFKAKVALATAMLARLALLLPWADIWLPLRGGRAILSRVEPPTAVVHASGWQSGAVQLTFSQREKGLAQNTAPISRNALVSMRVPSRQSGVTMTSAIELFNRS